MAQALLPVRLGFACPLAVLQLTLPVSYSFTLTLLSSLPALFAEPSHFHVSRYHSNSLLLLFFLALGRRFWSPEVRVRLDPFILDVAHVWIECKQLLLRTLHA